MRMIGFWRGMLAGAFLGAPVLAGPASPASAPPEPKPQSQPQGDLVFLPQRGRGTQASLVIETLDGTVVRKLPGFDGLSALRATPRGTVMALCYPAGFREVDRDGNILWQGEWKPREGPAVVTGWDVLPNGNLLLSFPEHREPKGGDDEALSDRLFDQQDEERTFILVEMDRNGAEARRLAIGPDLAGFGIASVRSAGEGAVLVATHGRRVFEIDWTGKVRFHLPLPEGCLGLDAVRLKSGDYVVSDAAGNRVLKVTPKGEAIWTAEKKCPTFLQPLPDGSVLVGGG